MLFIIGVDGRYMGMWSLTRFYLVLDGDIDTRVKTDREDKRHYFQDITFRCAIQGK